jgi:hypothetical protein
MIKSSQFQRLLAEREAPNSLAQDFGYRTPSKFDAVQKTELAAKVCFVTRTVTRIKHP